MGDFVQINVSNSQNDVVSFEKRFPRDVKIAELKVFKSFTGQINSVLHNITYITIEQRRWLICHQAKTTKFTNFISSSSSHSAKIYHFFRI